MVPVLNQLQIPRLRFGTLPGGAAGGTVRLVERTDLGTCALAVLTTPGQTPNRSPRPWEMRSRLRASPDRIPTVPPSATVGTSLAVTSNEPVNGTGDGDTEPDWEVVDAHHVRLRAERSRNGGGRVYSVAITASDSSGAASTRTVVVTVPMSQGR